MAAKSDRPIKPKYDTKSERCYVLWMLTINLGEDLCCYDDDAHYRPTRALPLLWHESSECQLQRHMTPIDFWSHYHITNISKNMLGQIAALRNTCNITVKDVIDLPTYRKSIVVGFNTLLCVRVFLLYCFNCTAMCVLNKLIKQGSHRPQTPPPVLPPASYLRPSRPWLQEVVPSVRCLQRVFLRAKPKAACEPRCLSLATTSSSLSLCTNMTSATKPGNT